MKHLTKLLNWSCCALLCAGISACYDGSSLRKDLDDLTNRVAQLEMQVKSINSSIESMSDILSKLQENVFVAKVETTGNGWRLTFTDGTSINIPGGNGASVVGVKEDSDGQYYWTLTGADGSSSWLTDDKGEKIPVSVKPVLSSDDEGYWTISCDGGKTFSRILDSEGQPISAGSAFTFFKDITCDDDCIHITLADGTVLDIPCRSNFYLLIKDAPETEEFEFGETKTYALESTGVERIVISKPDEWRVSVEGDVLTVTAPAAEHADCADMTGEVSLIYFSAGNLSSAVQLKVYVTAPKTIDLQVTATGMRSGNLYPGEMATVTVAITPSRDDFYYHVTAYNVTRYEESEEAYLATLVESLNYFNDGWSTALGSGNIRKGTAEAFEIPFLREGESYRIIACGVAQNESGKAYATTGVFFTDEVRMQTSAIDLGADGTSNTYIVNQPNTQYRFDAKVMGNGKTTTGITPKAIDPKKAFIVWETGQTKNAVIKDLTLSSDGYVTFTTGETVNGNALIAVTDGIPVEGQYSLGTILWSWHIWFTDYTADKDKKVVNHDSKEFMMMDCNLGDWNHGTTVTATSPFWGLKYQWGRKDPFIYFPYGTNAATVTHEDDYIWERSSIYPDTAEESLEIAVSNPTLYIQGGYSASNDWYGKGTGVDNRNNNLWGNAEGDPDKAVKTIYDPCPAGYKVAPVEAFSGFFTAGLDASALNPSEMNVEGPCNIGWNFITSGSEYSYFPLAGYMSNGSIYSLTRTGYYFTSTPSTATSSNTQVRMMRLETSSGYFNTANRADGASVRCVRE